MSDAAESRTLWAARVGVVSPQREAECSASQRNESRGGRGHIRAGRRLLLSELQAILELKPFQLRRRPSVSDYRRPLGVDTETKTPRSQGA